MTFALVAELMDDIFREGPRSLWQVLRLASVCS